MRAMRVCGTFFVLRWIMAQYDGSIRIGTGIDEKGFKAGSKELETGARSLAKSVSDSLGEGAKIALQKQTDAFVKLNQQYAAQEQKVKDLGSKLHEMQRTQVETPIFKETSKDLSAAEKRLDNLHGTLRRLEHEGRTDTRPYKDAIVQIDIYKKKVSELQNQLKELKQSGEAYQPADTSKVQKELAAAEQKQMQMYTALQTAADSLTQKTSERVAKEESAREKIEAEVAEEERLAQIRENAVVGNQRIVETVERIKQLEQEIADLKKTGVTEGYQDFDSRIQELSALKQEVRDYSSRTAEMQKAYVGLGAAVKQAFMTMGKGLIDIPIASAKSGARGLISIFQKLGGAVRKVAIGSFKLLGKIGKSVFSRLNKSASRSTGLMGTLASRFKGLALSLLIFNQISKAFNFMISGIKEGIRNLAQYSNDTNEALSLLMSRSTYLKNALATAFSPIIETITPILVRFIDLLGDAATKVSELFSALMGKDTFTKAVKVQQDYAESLKDTSKNTKKAAKETQKALAPFDDLRQIQFRQSDDEEKTEGGEIKPSDMFETNNIGTKVKEMSDAIKNAWENADFSGLSASIGEKLKNSLDGIRWNEIKEKVRKIGSRIATLINGFVEVKDLGYSIGKTLAEAVNTSFEFLNEFVHKLHWNSIGSFIADSLNGIFQNIDWQLIYDTFVTGAKGIGDAINHFVDELDWNVISKSVSNAVNTFVGTIYTLFNTVHWGDIGQKVGGFISDSLAGIRWEKAGQALGTGIQSIFIFLLSSIKNIQWGKIGTDIAVFLNESISSIDLHSLGEILGSLLTDMCNLSIDFASTFDWKKLGDNISNGINGFFESFDGAKFGKAATSILSGFLDAILKTIEEIDWSEIWRDIIDFLVNVNWLELIGKLVIVAGKLILGIVEGLIKAISETDWGEVWDNIVQAFKDFFGIHSPSTVMEEMGVMLIQGLINGIESLIERVNSIWQSMKESVSENFERIKGKAGELKDKFNDLKDSTLAVFDSIRQKITGALDSTKEKLNEFIDKIRDAIGAVKDFFKSGYEKIKSGVQSIFGGSEGIGRSDSFMQTAQASYIPEPIIHSIKSAKIPALATGTVVPPNREFLATLGDNKREPEIVSPISTMKQALMEALAESGISGGGQSDRPIYLQIDGKTFARLMGPYTEAEKTRIGVRMVTQGG